MTTCGNSVVEPGEQCDDGNTMSGDGCDAACQNEAPTGWTCDVNYYNAMDGCDCGCGIIDPDCPDATNASCDYCDDVGSCDTSSSGCPGLIDPNNNAVCIMTVCGNSVLEPGEQCDDGNTTSMDGCDATCQFEIPVQWSCNTAYYGTNDGCDCGCGVPDPDCPSALVGDCDYCDDFGSCGTGLCPANINPTNNAVCI
jgi:cysteine-rich repeat protein